MAAVLYKCGFIENWGRGTVNIIESCLSEGLPKPTFEYEWSALKVTFYKTSDQVSGRFKDILEFCRDPKSAQEIMNLIGVRHKTHFRQSMHTPLIKQGYLAPTIPDKPQSRQQKYITVIKDKKC